MSLTLDKTSGPNGRPILRLAPTPAAPVQTVPPRPATSPQPDAKVSRRAALRATEVWLRETFPSAFGDKVTPLVIGVHKQLVAAARVAGHPRRAVLALLARRTRSYDYINALAASGAIRRRLDGEEVEPVSEEHRSQAQAQLARRAHHRETPPASQIKIEPVGGMGLTDLTDETDHSSVRKIRLIR